MMTQVLVVLTAVLFSAFPALARGRAARAGRLARPARAGGDRAPGAAHRCARGRGRGHRRAGGAAPGNVAREGRRAPRAALVVARILEVLHRTIGRGRALRDRPVPAGAGPAGAGAEAAAGAARASGVRPAVATRARPRTEARWRARLRLLHGPLDGPPSAAQGAAHGMRRVGGVRGDGGGAPALGRSGQRRRARGRDSVGAAPGHDAQDLRGRVAPVAALLGQRREGDPGPAHGRDLQRRHGEFFSHELHQGRGVLVRYLWSDITPASCHWEQAFSPDGGRTWETNWIMDFTRRA